LNQIVEGELDEVKDMPWWKIMVYLPQLHLETPPLFTAEHAEELKEEIAALSDYCPHCKKKI